MTEDRRAHERIDELAARFQSHLDEDVTIHQSIMTSMAENTALTKKSAEMTIEGLALAKTTADNTTELVAIVKGARVIMNGSKWTAVWIRRLALWVTPILVVAGLIIEWVRH